MGRKLDSDLRDAIIRKLANTPEGMQAGALARLLNAEYSTVNHACHELCGLRKDRGYGQRLHIDRWDKRRDAKGRPYDGGRPAPVFKLGAFHNAERPEPTKSALEQRRRYWAERRIELAAREKIETERRRALKRKPAMDALTAAMFGRPMPK